MRQHYCLVILSLLSGCRAQNLVCQEEVTSRVIYILFSSIYIIFVYYLCLPLQVWQPADEPPIYNQECEVYDGSLIPDCDYFLNNYTSYYHVHEYSETC